MEESPPGDLRLRVAELSASRQRLLVAADAERQRIERDLHDGAQQHLVALLVNLQLARQVAGSDPDAVVPLLGEITRDARDALDGLRLLAHRIYPALLVSAGLTEALRAAGSDAGVATSVDAQLDRYPPEVEATAYFCCLEALNNVAQHAGEGVRAAVRAWHDDQTLSFEVRDDGVGFEPDSVSPGGGLTRISDRLGAHGGCLAVSSEPGRGTCIRGTIPVAG